MSGGCKDLTRPTSIIYIFKITEAARRLFFLETVLKQDTLLLHNPKECKGKKFVLSSSLRIPDPSLLGDPRLISLPGN